MSRGAFLIMLALAAALTVSVGANIRSARAPVEYRPCALAAIPGSANDANTPPCPPSDERVVIATWPGGTSTLAHYSRHSGVWIYRSPAGGFAETRQPPAHWEDL